MTMPFPESDYQEFWKQERERLKREPIPEIDTTGELFQCAVACYRALSDTTKEWIDANFLNLMEFYGYRPGSRQQETRQAEGGVPANTKHPDGEVLWVEAPPGSPDVAGP